MHIDTQRRIDRHAGVPLCAVATVMTRLWRLVRNRAARPVRKVLFLELSEMGSTVLAEPAMRKARERLGAELYFVIFARGAGALDFSGTVERANVFTIRDTSLWHLMLDSLAFLRWTRRMGIDTV